MHFRRGQKFPDLVFLGACPGQEEWNAIPRRPFAGQSGKNIRILLRVLQGISNKSKYGFMNSDFISLRLDDYTLMNSHPDAKWEAEHGRTTPKISEVKNAANIVRISDEIAEVNARIVIGLGRPVDDTKLTRIGNDSGPMRAIRLLKPKHPRISFCITGHPSQQAINLHGGGNAEDWFRKNLRGFP